MKTTLKKIKRSLLFSLECANTGKKAFLHKLWNEYRKVLQYFIDLAVERNRLPNYQDVKSYPGNTFLSARYKDCALQQAKATLKSYFKLKRKRRDRPIRSP